jgi:hypothetical protein
VRFVLGSWDRQRREEFWGPPSLLHCLCTRWSGQLSKNSTFSFCIGFPAIPKLASSKSCECWELRHLALTMVLGQVSFVGCYICRHLGQHLVSSTSRSAGAAALLSKPRRRSARSSKPIPNLFVPFAVEIFGPFGEESLGLVKDLGRRISDKIDEIRSK